MDKYKRRVKPLLFKRNLFDDWPEWNHPWVGRVFIIAGFIAFFSWFSWPIFDPYAVSDLALNAILAGIILGIFLSTSIVLAAVIDAEIF